MFAPYRRPRPLILGLCRATPIRIPAEIPKPRDSIFERAAMAHTARTEMQKIMKSMQVARGLKYAFPVANATYDAG